MFWCIKYEEVGDIADDKPLHSNLKNIQLHIELYRIILITNNYHITDNEHNNCISFTTCSISTTMSTCSHYLLTAVFETANF